MGLPSRPNSNRQSRLTEPGNAIVASGLAAPSFWPRTRPHYPNRMPAPSAAAATAPGGPESALQPSHLSRRRPAVPERAPDTVSRHRVPPVPGNSSGRRSQQPNPPDTHLHSGSPDVPCAVPADPSAPMVRLHDGQHETLNDGQDVSRSLPVMQAKSSKARPSSRSETASHRRGRASSSPKTSQSRLIPNTRRGWPGSQGWAGSDRPRSAASGRRGGVQARELLRLRQAVLLERFADPNAPVKAGLKRPAAVIAKASHSPEGAERARQWLDAAQASLGLYAGPAVAFADLAAEVATAVRLLRGRCRPNSSSTPPNAGNGTGGRPDCPRPLAARAGRGGRPTLVATLGASRRGSGEASSSSPSSG